MITKDLLRTKGVKKALGVLATEPHSSKSRTIQSLLTKYILPLLLLFVGVVLLGKVAAAGASQSTQEVAVAKTNIPSGAIITSQEIELKKISTSLALKGTFNSSAEVTGERTLAPITQGELLQKSMVSLSASNTGNASLVVVQVPSDIANAESITAGERVDITATFNIAGSPVTQVLASKVLVKEIYIPPTSIGTSASTDIVLALYDPQQALAILQGENSGKVGVIQSTGAKGIAPGTSYPPLVSSVPSGTVSPQNLPG